MGPLSRKRIFRNTQLGHEIPGLTVTWSPSNTGGSSFSMEDFVSVLSVHKIQRPLHDPFSLKLFFLGFLHTLFSSLFWSLPLFFSFLDLLLPPSLLAKPP